jgi:predicted amidohydrolase YtcJ
MLAATALFVTSASNLAAAVRDTADAIYRGGPILTMNDAMPRVEAVAVKDGRILAVGTLADVLPHRGEQTELVELEGRAMLPGFVDSHGHVVLGGLQALAANLLAPPDGDVTDIPGLVAVLTAWAEANADTVAAVNLIVGFGYDQSQLAEKRHPTRNELDRVSTDVPIIIVHQSGHFGVASTKALEVVGFSAETPDPDGGIIRRGANGEPDGVLEENAFFAALATLLKDIGADGFKEFARAGARLWASFG